MKTASVILVDDDPELLRQLNIIFAGAGYRVRTASDGEVALKLFTADPPDVVVTDIVMPTREGIETIIAMRAASRQVRIVAMSGGGRIAAGPFLTLAKHLGADVVVPKPFRPKELLRTVENLLRTRWKSGAAA